MGTIYIISYYWSCAEKSSAFGTTLWFSDEDKKENVLDSLIACGEFTACNNLLPYLIRHHAEKIKIEDSDEYELYTKLKAQWELFMDDPYNLIKQRKMNMKD